jgi:hypothetical protein
MKQKRGIVPGRAPGKPHLIAPAITGNVPKMAIEIKPSGKTPLI